MLTALIMSTLAGLSTALGGLLAFFSKREGTRFLSFALGFSAGVMILVSFAELLPEAKENIADTLGPYGGWATIGSLFFGIVLSVVIEKLVPGYGDMGAAFEGSVHPAVKRPDRERGSQGALLRMGLVTAVAITAHNFPEGIATFMAGYSNFRVGLPVTISIAMHNIPEGIAVAVPVYYGTGSRAKALGYSALSGLSEPLGALAAYLILAPFLSPLLLGIIYGTVAGIMIYISFDELLPASEKYKSAFEPIAGILTGFLVMWIALKVFGS